MSETKFLRRSLRILVLNPNSSTAMTAGMENAIRQIPLPDNVEIFTYTASPSAPASIDDGEDIAASTKAVLEDTKLINDLESDKYDAVLVACFSVHTLVDKLSRYQHLAVTGIFEASLVTSLALLPAPQNKEKWAIVTTGKFWEEHLSTGVKDFVGQRDGSENSKFAGVFSTGLTAGDFHHISLEKIREKLVEATKELLNSGSIGCVVMGCGGMAGLEDIIRSTAVEQYGKAVGDRVLIIDGVKAGIIQLEAAIKSRKLFR